MSLEEKHDTASEEMRDNETWDKSEHQSPFVLQSELENETDSGNAQPESEELNINKKLTMLQNVFKTVGSDLEDIKALMLRLRELLSNGCDREKPEDLNKQIPCCSEGNFKEVIVIDDSDDDGDDSLQESLRLQREAAFEAAPTRESSVDSFNDGSYSTLVADIEILKTKLVALKKNLAE